MGFLRATFWLLLAIGVVVKPLLGDLCNVHALDHAASAEVLPEHEIDADHASGKHGLVHEDDNSGGAYVDLGAVTIVPAMRYHPSPIPVPNVPAVPFAPASGPFRPPIA